MKSGKQMLREFPEYMGNHDRLIKADSALEELEAANNPAYNVQFMQEIVDIRIESPPDSRIWQAFLTSPSIRATGRTEKGNAVVVYAHVPNYFSRAENLTKVIEQRLMSSRGAGQPDGAGRMSQPEFQRLLDLADNERVFVVDYEALKHSPSGVISLKQVLNHPQTVPFLGGQGRAEKYLEKHDKVYGNKIGVWHSDDLFDEPLARLLTIGDDGGGVNGSLGGGGGLCADLPFYGGCRFVGIPVN